jgi:hypothetical protein
MYSTVFFTKNATAASENPMLMYRNVDLNALSLKAKNCTDNILLLVVVKYKNK